MSNQIKLQQPVIKGSIPSTNFFNGRLVTGADMTREQTARRDAVSRIGQALGEGIAYGLEVKENTSSGNDSTVTITAGLAINRCGQTMRLSEDTSLNLLERFGTIEQSSSIFGECKPLEVGTYAAGHRLYLLVISPAESSEGSAPTSGLNNAFSTCNTDVVLETAQFRLLAIDPFLTGETLPDQILLRNYITYRCFGTAEMQKFFADPINGEIDSYGLIDEMREKTLSKSDVPLAIINWTSSGIRFIEMWAVRRRLTKRADEGGWTQLINDRRATEAEAIMRQFEDQISRIELETTNSAAIEADDYFRYLPPAGMLPLSVSGSQKGFNAFNFFAEKGATNIVNTDGDRLRILLNQALLHEPIDLNTDDKIWLYYVRENLQAIDDGDNVRKVLVFARHSLPYIGVARFDEAEFDQDRFSDAII